MLGAIVGDVVGSVHEFRETALARLTPDLRAVVDRFCQRYPVPQP
jgi:hypothetical protein